MAAPIEAQLVWLLRNAPPNVLLQRDAADEIERLRRVMAQRNVDAAEEARSSAIEARWQERQEQSGEPYGTY